MGKNTVIERSIATDIVFWGLAICTTIYTLFMIFPIFTAFYYWDDLGVLDLYIANKGNPLALFTAYDVSWWKPLSIFLAGFFMQIGGLNALPIHIAGFIVHLGIGLALWHFAKKLFDNQTAWLAYCLYITSGVMVPAVGFATNTMQDGMSILLGLLCMICVIRTDASKSTRKPYYLPALWLLLSAMCKPSWIALLPAVLLADWLNYPKSQLNSRLIRWIPFVFAIATLLMRYLPSGTEAILTDDKYMATHLRFDNLLNCFSLPFVHSMFFYYTPIWCYGWAVMSLLLIAIFIILSKKEIIKSFVIIISYFAYVALLVPATFYPGFSGWAHLFPLMVFSSIIISYIITKTRNSLNLNIIFKNLFNIIIVCSFLLLSSFTCLCLLKDNIKDLKCFYLNIRELKHILRNTDAGTHVYAIKGLPVNWVKEYVVTGNLKYTNISIIKNISTGKYNINNDNKIEGDYAYIYNIINGLSCCHTNRFIALKNGYWADITNDIQIYFNKQIKYNNKVNLFEYLDI